jgi:ABC-type transporter MlaC component
VTVGDFNGDGKPDLAVSNSDGDNVSILLGNGNGTFQTAINYAVGSDPFSVIVGDFNGDGKLDLAVANYSTNNVSVLLGNGNGTFQTAVNYAVGAYPRSGAAGDFNGDGKLDLAVANQYGSNVSILLGNGNGTFQEAVSYAVGVEPFSVIVGDFNGDGKLDLAVANWESSNVSILLNTTIYTITATAGDNGSISPSGAVTVIYGSNQNFTITPNFGYHVADVLVDGSSVGAVTSYEFSNVTADHTISASFAIDTYTITATAGVNGSISPSGAVMVNHGSSQSFTIIPSAGYHVADVLVDGASVGTVTSYEFTNVSADHAISASFAINIYNITAAADSNGSITPLGAVNVNHGSNQSFTITPSAGYHVADVLVDGVSQGAITSYQFSNVTANHTISASFAINTYTITATTGANGNISPSGGVTVDHGNNQSFTITPSAGYHVADVLVDGVSQGAITSYQFNSVIANHTISASFAINTYTITASAGVNGSISPSGAMAVNYGSNQSFTITPNTGYHVADVLVDGVSQGAVTDYQFNNVTANHTISASFVVTTGATTPTGTINAGTGYSYTYSTSGSPDGEHPAEFQFDWKGDESDLSPWGSSTQTKNWSFVGTHTVRARVRCALHTSVISDWSSGLRVVVIDPNFVDFKINDGAASTVSSSVTLTYTTTGNPRYIRISTGSAWKSWQDLSAITLPHTISLGSTNGIREVFAQVKDDQGRVSPVARASIILDTTAPKGVVKINGGSTAVADGGAGGTPVRLHLAMFDANMTGAKMRIKKDVTFVSPVDDNLWEDFTTGKDVTLTAGMGTRKVYVQFKDGVGKTSSIYSTSINVGAMGGLLWPGVSEATVNNLQLSDGTGTSYSIDTDVTLSCTMADYTGLSARYLWGTSWTPWEPLAGNNVTKTLALSTANGPRQVYMQLKEDSTGRMTDPQAATIILDTKIPTGVVQINNGSSSVPQNTASVTLTIVASDYASGIDKMAIYQTGEVIPNPIHADDPRFQDFAPTVAEYALNTSTTGTKTVYIWIKDKAGKISAAIKDTISVVVP